MAIRRVCKLSNSDYKDIDLRQYAQLIIDTINETVPNKNPEVKERSFSTDHLSHGEAVKVGVALSRLQELVQYGKEVRTFRLFDGKEIDIPEPEKPKIVKGGRPASNKEIQSENTSI